MNILQLKLSLLVLQLIFVAMMISAYKLEKIDIGLVFLALSLITAAFNLTTKIEL